MKRKTLVLLLLLFLFFLPIGFLYAQEENSYKGTVKDIKEVSCAEVLDEGYNCFTYEVSIPELDTVEETIPMLAETETPKFNEGDKVYITSVTDEFGNEAWSITGYDRDMSMIIMIASFSILVVLIGRKQGLGSLISLVLTVFILYVWAIPKLLNGQDVILIGVLAVCVMLVLMIYLSHGFNKKSSIGVLATVIGMLLVAILARLFMSIINLDGAGSEEAFLLFSQTDGGIDLAQVYFLSILVSAVGVLDDVIMSQISSVYEIHEANNHLSALRLYKKAMNIGRDHISSMVNTLFIAYAGSSLSLVMLLTYNRGGIGNILKTDVIAEEITRTVVPSLGILLIVPIATFLAATLVPLSEKRKSTG